ncbi:TRAP transporter small permease [Tistrella bauzanensis]|uniref:TRAP transporter small permease protein n=1 Tax=Tistrella arctica TaxID=3133430 RepID=A0ABU9YK46_9PROT
MKKLHDRLGQFEWGLASVGAGLCLFTIMIITVLSVFGRYVLLVDLIPGGYNIIERMLFPLMVFWALPLAHRDGIFPRLELVSTLLSRRLGTVVAILMLLVELAVFLFILWYVTQYALAGWRSDRAMQLGSGFFPVWPFIAMVPVAFGLMAIEMIWQIGRHIHHFAAGRAVPQVHGETATGAD